MRTAVIGGGIAGLACTRALVAGGANVVLYDKARHLGGRMASRRLPSGAYADHGARAFVARDERFAAEVQSWVNAGLAARWTPLTVSIEQPGTARTILARSHRYVGSPSMHAPLRKMAESLGQAAEIRRAQNVRQIHRAGRARGSWTVTTATGDTESFDTVILATPAGAAANLLTEIPHLRGQALGVPMAPCWATTVRFAERLPIDFDAANVLIGGRHANAGLLAWMNRESSKPGRPIDEVWVLHAAEEWSRDHAGDQPEEVAERMTAAFFEAAGLDPTPPAQMNAHRWKAAFPVAPLCDGCLYDEQLAIGVCGDWCMGARVEAGYLSGLAVAARALGEPADFFAPSLACNKHT